MFDYEVYDPAKPSSNLGSRNSAGISISTHLPSCKWQTEEGYCKAKINGIHFFNIYINLSQTIKKKKLINKVKQLVTEGKKIIISGDFNQDSKMFKEIFNSFGMQFHRIAERRDRKDIEYIFTYGIDIEVTKVINRLSNEGNKNHNSDHSCFIIKINKAQVARDNIRLLIPNDEEKMKEFLEEYKKIKIELEDKIMDRAKLFYISIYLSASRLNYINNKFKKAKLKSYLSKKDLQYFHLKKREANQYFNSDRNKYNEMIKDIQKYRKEKNKESWTNYVENTTKNCQYFKPINTMAKKGSLWVDGENLTDLKTKSVELKTNLEKTEERWREFIGTKFAAEQEENAKIPCRSKSIDLTISAEHLKIVFAKCKMKTSPGSSKIGYKLLKDIFEYDTQFFTEMIQDVMNDKCDTSLFSQMDVIPVYKTNKKGPESECNSYRLICLGENLFKLCESLFINMNIDKIEEGCGGKQFAYKRKSGVSKAIKEINDITRRRGKGIMIAVDVKAAFDSPYRNKTFETTFDHLDNYSFLHMYKRVLDNLELNINLKFMKIKGIPSRKGSPQGMKFSAFTFCFVMNKIMSNLKGRLSDIDFDYVIYSDDLTLIVNNIPDYLKIMRELEDEMKKFNLYLDPAKTQYTTFGDYKCEKLKLWNNQDLLTCCKAIRILGVYFFKEIGFDIEKHTKERQSSINKYFENKLVRFVSLNYSFNLKTQRIFLTNRTFAKIYYGVSFLNKVLNPEFDELYAFEYNDCKYLDRSWNEYDKIDYINWDMAKEFVKKNKVIKGASKVECIMAILRIKPLHTLSYRFVDDGVLTDYWLKSKTLRTSHHYRYLKQSEHIISGLHKRKFKLNNEHLLLSLMSGHYIWFLNNNYRQERTVKCNKCNLNLGLQNLYSDEKCCGLRIPGKVPVKELINGEHIEFSKFVNSLTSHPMFNSIEYSWKTDKQMETAIIPSQLRIKKTQLTLNEKTRIYREDLIKGKECIIAYTDGSCFENYYAASGVNFLNKSYWKLKDIVVAPPIPYTNIRSELYAILLSINYTHHYPDKKLIIKTDSLYSINAITRWYDIWKLKGFKNSSGNIVSNLDLLHMIYQLSERRQIEYVHVYSHTGNIMNELVDSECSKHVRKNLLLMYGEKFFDICEYNKNLAREYNKNNYNFKMTNQNRNNLTNFYIDEDDEKNELSKLKHNEYDKITNKRIFKIPVWWIPNDMCNCYDKTTIFKRLKCYVNDVLTSYSIVRNIDPNTLKTDNLQHPLELITKVDLIKGADRRNRGKIIAWNLCTVGKFDCTVLGIIIALGDALRMSINGILQNYTVAQNYSIGFSAFKMNADKNDPIVFFQTRMNQHEGLQVWINARKGRTAERGEWVELEVDQREEDNQDWLDQIISGQI